MSIAVQVHSAAAAAEMAAAMETTRLDLERARRGGYGLNTDFIYERPERSRALRAERRRQDRLRARFPYPETAPEVARPLR
jgi:hypothetical protein